MTTVYVVTAQPRRHLPHRTGLPRPRLGVRVRARLQRIAPVESVQVEEWQIGAPPGPTTALLAGGVVGAGAGQQAARAAAAHRDGERRDDFDIRQEWWTGDALPEPR